MIVTIEGIPVYNAVVSDEGTGMFRISLVDDPAVMSNFQAFDSHRRPLMYAVQDEEKRLVRGVVMRADFPIYRNDKQLGEYYVIYKADQIRRMAEKYLLESRQNDVNLMHEAGSDVEGVQMVQYFIKDTAAGVDPEGFADIADGSLFAEYHVVNDDVWAEIKAGTYKGFSLEGVFDLVPEEDVDEVQEIVDTLGGAFSRLFSKFQNHFGMSKLSKFRAALAKALQQYGTVTTDKGILSWDGDEDLKAGDAVFIEDADGNRTSAADGDYITSDGKKITVSEGKVSEIVDAEAEVSDDFASKATDKGELHWDGEDDLKAGDEVFTLDEAGERTPAADGEYRTEDGKVIVVVDGKVAEIRDDEAEVADQEVDASAARALRYSRMKALLEESFNDKIQAIQDALREQGIEGYIIDAGDDFAIVDVWDGEEEKLYRYDITFNEDGTVTLGDRKEVKPAFVPVDEDAYPDDELQDLRRENAALRSQVEQLKKKPAAKPAHEEFRGTTGAVKTGIRSMDNLARIISSGR